jgi:hypothetical protein
VKKVGLLAWIFAALAGFRLPPGTILAPAPASTI